MSLFSRLAIGTARALPTSWKAWVHRHRALDDFSRSMFSGMLGQAPLTISSGPLAGVKLMPSEHTSHAHLSGTYESDVLEAVARVVRPGDVCLDLGASIGYLSLLMAHRGARRVYAFEPAPHAQQQIRAHAAANGWEKTIDIVPLPVSDRPKLVRFGLTNVAYGSAIAYGETSWETIELTTTTLDAFIRDHGAPDFVKIDVEGEEDLVLEGARSLLQAQKTAFCVELHSDEDALNCQRLFEEFHYQLFQLDGQPWTQRRQVKAGEVQLIAYPTTRMSEFYKN